MNIEIWLLFGASRFTIIIYILLLLIVVLKIFVDTFFIIMMLFTTVHTFILVYISAYFFENCIATEIILRHIK